MIFSKAEHLSGFMPSATAAWIAQEWEKTRVPVLALAPTQAQAEQLYRDLLFFTNTGEAATQFPVGYFPAWDVLPFDALSPSVATSAARLHSLFLLQHGAPIVVTSISAAMQRILLPETLRQLTIRLSVGANLERDSLLSTLIAAGYLRTKVVEEYGQLAVRGSVIDIFPPGTDTPIRIEFYDSIIESLRLFASDSQRSLSSVEYFDILPVREMLVGNELLRLGDGSGVRNALRALRERAAELLVPAGTLQRVEEAIVEGIYWPGIEHLQPLISDDLGGILDYVPQEARLYLLDPHAAELEADGFASLVAERAHRAEIEARLFPNPERAYLAPDSLFSMLAPRVGTVFTAISFIQAGDLEEPAEAVVEPKRSQGHGVLHQELQRASHGSQPLKPLADYLKKLLQKRISPILVAATSQRQQRLAELLENYDLTAHIVDLPWAELNRQADARPIVKIVKGYVSHGFIDYQQHRAVISEHEIFPERKELQQDASRGKASVKRLLRSLGDLNEGDFVVHLEYGIGRYLGLRQKKIDGLVADFLELVYAEGAKLFLPVEALGKVQKYAGPDASEPKLTKLGGKVWDKAKSKVQEQVAAVAGRLISTMAQRETATGFSFGEVTAEDRAFADAFPYVETPDQSKAIADVLADMARERPMDRLVCGDVGYGKTEVAMRAAYKAACAGKQVAVIVPTTVLARQHYASFLERFEGTAVSIGSVSRFNAAEENKRVLHGVASGAIDVVIGTHRLLQRDVYFRDLGLVIIDEEHRFGVVHKERLKRFRADVDILTLSATPIPRTLHMSLVGIRDLSLIETAPTNRQVIRTYLAEYDAAIVREAMLRELSRSGQVFFIHNRVQTIDAVAAELQELVPEARFAVGHGQMPERQLERVMHQFLNKEVDVLVATTIVESGLDISNANTIIIKNAERFGLAELYQLRGRVGRSSKRAYAYLMIGNPNSLTQDARKRLEVLQALDDLGVGFKLALQDMEIRGAGNLLGKDQSGHIQAIGYELYSRILRDAIEQARGLEQSADQKIVIDPEIKLGFPTHIPPWYLPDVSERLLLYQRLIEVENESELPMMLEEVVDRFGSPPPEVEVLFESMALRAFARRHGIEVMRRTNEAIAIQFHPLFALDPQRLAAQGRSMKTVRISPSGAVHIPVYWPDVGNGRELLERIRPFIEELVGPHR